MFRIVRTLMRLGGGIGLAATPVRAWELVAQTTSQNNGTFDLVTDWSQLGILGVVFWMAFKGSFRWEREVTMRDAIIAELKADGKAKDAVIATLQDNYVKQLETLLHEAVEVIPPLLEERKKRRGPA